MSRPKGSKNKPKKSVRKSKGKIGKRAKDLQSAQRKDKEAEYFTKLFIAAHGIDEAEFLADRVLQKIRANKKRLDEKYGKE